MIEFFNKKSFYESAAKVRVAPGGFRYGYIPDVFNEDVYRELAKTFPDVGRFELVSKQSGGGLKRFYTGPVYYSEKDNGCLCHFDHLPGIWRKLIKETDSERFKNFLKETTGVSFNSLTNFGFTYGNEGCVQEAHIDGEIRDSETAHLPAIACLLYFNAAPDRVGGTCVYGTDRKTVLLQAPHLRNGLFFFEQHPDAWHGFPVMPKGADRYLVSLAYNTKDRPVPLNDLIFHRLTCVRRYKNKIRKALGRKTK